METVVHGAARRKWRSQKLTLQQYQLFVENKKLADDLTVDQLNQIIQFHGYKKMHKVPKKTLVEALGTLELIKPSRSTLQDADVSSCALISLDTIVKDLNALGWQECCVTSMQMFNSVDLQPQQPLKSNASTVSGSKEKKQPKKRQKKLMKLLTNVDGNNADTSGGGPGDTDGICSSGLGAGGSQSASCSSVIPGRGAARAMKLAPKRKRSPRVVGVGNVGHGGGSTSVC